MLHEQVNQVSSKLSTCYENIIKEIVLLSFSESIRKLTEIWNKFQNSMAALSDLSRLFQADKNIRKVRKYDIVANDFRWLGYSLFQKVITFARDSTRKDTVELMNSLYFTVKFSYQILERDLSR